MINKDTQIYCSFSKNRGNVGTKIFNTCFAYYGINSLYRSFSVEDIGPAVSAARCLQFSGFAVSMPFKKAVIEHLDSISVDAEQIGAVNTVVNKSGLLKGYNTDWQAAKTYLEQLKISELYILGDGGYAQSVKYASEKLKIRYKIINRQNWDLIERLENKTIFNCTPVENIQTKIKKNNLFIDCITTTKTGKHLAMLQSAKQFELYTNLQFPLKVENEKV